MACGCVSLYVSEVANGPGEITGSDGAVPQEDAKGTRGFSAGALAMKVGLEVSARKFSFCSYWSQGKMTLRACFSVKQGATQLLLLETR